MKHLLSKKTTHLVLVFSAVVVLSVLSETLYLYKNRPHLLTYPYLKMAVSWAEKSRVDRTTENIFSAANILIRKNSSTYGTLIPKSFRPGASNTRGLEKVYKNYLPTLELKKVLFSENHSLSLVFYNLGILAYKEGEIESFPSFLQAAVYIEPELSHYHVELANYYFLFDEKQKGKSALEYCFNFTYPVTHCRDYKDYISSGGNPLSVGFLQEEIEKYYDSLEDTSAITSSNLSTK